MKYVRDDKFVYDYMLDDAARKRVDQAWKDLYASFEYHDNYVQLLAEHYKYDLKGKHVSKLGPADARRDARRSCAGISRRTWRSTRAVQAAQAAARPRHVQRLPRVRGARLAASADREGKGRTARVLRQER